MDFKVTLIQSDLKIGDLNYNFKKIKDYLNEAVLEETDLIVLPETWNTGFGNKVFENIEDYAQKENSDYIKYLKNFALEKDVYIVGGTIIEKERDGNIYNNLYFFDRKGNTLGKYSKMHLYSPGGENRIITPGHSLSMVNTDLGKYGFMVCYDIRFPELARLYALEEIDVLFVVANFNDPKRNQWLNQLKARAMENQYYVVACNRSGKKYFGNSVIISPDGEITMNAGRREGIYSGYIDLNLLKAVRKELPLLEDRRDDLFEINIRRGE